MTVYEKVLAHYGHEAQKEKACEELQELIIELRKDLTFDGELDRKAMLTEIADVYNMLNQLLMIYEFERLIKSIIEEQR